MNTTNKALPPPKKRSFDAMINNSSKEDKEEHFTEEEMASMSRSERKRHREKKRRSDVNKGFDELMALLLEIDPEVREEAEDRASKGQLKRVLGAHEDNVLSRVDLIATSIKVLKRVHEENEKHKQMVEELLKGNGAKTASVTAAARPAVNSGNAFQSSFLDRASLLQERAALLQQSAALGVGAGASSAQSAWESAQQLRAAQQASIYGNSATTPHQFGGYSASELMAMRAAASSGRASTSTAASDANLLAHLTQRNQFLQSLLQGPNASATGPAPGTITEALYGALGPGQMPSRKEKDYSAEAKLRRLREQRLG